MKKITPELEKLFDNAAKYAPKSQVFRLLLWTYFVPKKRDKLLECLIKGMHWKAAYETAKGVK